MTLFSFVFASLALAEPIVFDRAVASIEGRVITSSQLQFEARVLLVSAGGREAAFAPLDQAALESSLRIMIDERLALIEADKLDAYPLDPDELEQAIVAFRSKFDGEDRFALFLHQHEADLNDLAAVLKRSIRSQRALEGKLRLRAQVSEGDARAWQLEHPETKTLPIQNVRMMLVQKRFADLARQELADQRRSVDVRLLGPFSPRTAAP